MCFNPVLSLYNITKLWTPKKVKQRPKLNTDKDHFIKVQSMQEIEHQTTGRTYPDQA